MNFLNEQKDNKWGQLSEEEKLQLLSASINIYAEKATNVEKKINDRMDLIEVAMKRPGGVGNVDNISGSGAEGKNFAVAMHLNRDKNASIPFDKIGDIKPVSSSDLKDYSVAMDKLIRRGYERLFDAERKGLSEGIDSDGGYTVTPYMSNKIITRQREVDPLRGLCSNQTITTNAFESLVDADDSGAEWVSELGSRDETTNPAFKGLRIPVHELYSLVPASQQLLEDSGINVETWLANKFGDKFARSEGAAFISADGAGKPRGILTYPSGTSWGQIEQVHMGNAALLTADGFIKLKYSLNSFHLNRAAFLMNRNTLALAMEIKNGIGDYIFRPSANLAEPATICGLPVYISPTVPDVAAGSMAVVCADFQEAYMIVDRIGFSLLRDPYTQKKSGLVEFLARKRVGGGVTNFDAVKIGTIEV